MNRRKFLKSGLIWVPAFPAIVRAQSEDWYRVASEGAAAAGGGGSLSYVNSSGKHWFGSSGTMETTSAITVTAGHLLACFVGWGNNQAITASSCGSNTLVAIDSSVNAGASAATYYCKNVASGSTTFSISWGADPGAGFIVMFEVAGANTSTPLDVHAILQSVAPNTTPVTSGNVTTTANGEFVMGGCVDPSGTATLAAGSGYTLQPNVTSIGASEYQIQTSSGVIAATFGQTGGNFDTYVVAVATFKA